jgi:hypothetical protein
MQEKIYFNKSGMLLTDKGFRIRIGGNVYPLSDITGKIEKEVIMRTNKPRALIFWFLATFIFTIAEVSRSPFPIGFTYLIGGILIIVGFVYFFAQKTIVKVFLKGNEYIELNLSGEKDADTFIEALNEALKNKTPRMY